MYAKTNCKLNPSQLGPWLLKGHLSMRALSVGRPCDGPNGAAGYPAPTVSPPITARESRAARGCLRCRAVAQWRRCASSDLQNRIK